MNESDLINEIIKGGKAQNAQADAAERAAEDRQNQHLQKRQTASLEWPTFRAEFAEMIAGVNTAIAAGAVSLNLPEPATERHDPTLIGRITVSLKRGSRPPRESLVLSVRTAGKVEISAHHVDMRFDDYKLNTVDSPMVEFRALILMFCRAATISGT